MQTVTITTPWSGDGKTIETAFKPQFTIDFPAVQWIDITGADPKRDLSRFNIQAQVDADTLSQIQANPIYAISS